MAREFSKIEILRRVLSCSYQTAKEILEGTRKMNLAQKILLEKYNKDASPAYKIEVK